MQAEYSAQCEQLKAFIDTEANSLLESLRLYVIRAGLAYQHSADAHHQADRPARVGSPQ